MENDFIPFHKPYFTEDEINEVTDSIRSGWWTTGPKTIKFENEFKNYIGAKYSVSANSWTGAAHLALEAIGLKEGDEVIVPSFTFTASAEIVCYFKAKPVIVDIQKDSYNIDPEAVEKAITPKTKAIIPVHYGGNPCDMDEIMNLAKVHNLKVLEDAAHSLPAYYKGKKIGTIGDITCFSFYATKTLATGEGGMVCTDDEEIARRCSIMRLHGINNDAWKRYTSEGSWYYEVIAPGYKYNFNDIQAALGLAQLRKIDDMHSKRKDISRRYDEAFKNNEHLTLYKIKDDRASSYHLYPILLNIDNLNVSRAEFINELKKLKVGSSVHFIPLYKHPYYRDSFDLDEKLFPISEYVYKKIVTLPVFPGMTPEQVDRVTFAVNHLIEKFKR